MPPPIKAPVAGLPPVSAETPAPAPAPIKPPVTARVPGLLPQPVKPSAVPIRSMSMDRRMVFLLQSVTPITAGKSQNRKYLIC
jgi:hypothetical protein